MLMTLAAAMFSGLSGCDQHADDQAPAATSPAIEIHSPVLWKHVQDATVVAVNDPSIENDLARATGEAKRSLEDARKRWAVSKPAERSLWAIKWAAPLAANPENAAGGAIEHVWVQPVNWSPFRIEGVLMSSPIAPLECGKSRGEIVSFPIDELTDWLHVASDAPDAAFEGGYTVKVLEAKYGKDAG